VAVWTSASACSTCSTRARCGARPRDRRHRADARSLRRRQLRLRARHEGRRAYDLPHRPRAAPAAPLRPAGSPYGLAYDLEHRRIWVTLTATTSSSELSVGAGRGSCAASRDGGPGRAASRSTPRRAGLRHRHP
jgi:hypothetical protein